MTPRRLALRRLLDREVPMARALVEDGEQRIVSGAEAWVAEALVACQGLDAAEPAPAVKERRA